eukprot:7814093-Pyramimonas_sp.AAC.1
MGANADGGQPGRQILQRPAEPGLGRAGPGLGAESRRIFLGRTDPALDWPGPVDHRRAEIELGDFRAEALAAVRPALPREEDEGPGLLAPVGPGSGAMQLGEAAAFG